MASNLQRYWTLKYTFGVAMTPTITKVMLQKCEFKGIVSQDIVSVGNTESDTDNKEKSSRCPNP
jgi:hypothetical protein